MSESHESAGPDPAARRFRLASPATATALGVLALILMALALALSGLTDNLSVLGSGPIVPVVVVYAAVGVVVARRQPGNPIGWILITFIVMFLLSDVVGAYAALYYRFGHHGLPLAAAAEILQPLWAPAIVLFPVAILLFPDGRLASRRWRWALRVYAVAGALASMAVFAPAVSAVASHDVRVDAFGDIIASGHARGGPLAAAEVLGLCVILALWLSFVGHQVLSWRRAAGEQRQQLKWLATGGAVTLVVIAVSFGISSTSVSGEILGIGLAALPVGIGGGDLEVPAVRHRPDHQPDSGLRDRDRGAGRGVRGAGAAGHPGPAVPRHSGGGGRHAGRGGAVRARAPTRPARGGQALQPGSLQRRRGGSGVRRPAEGRRGSGLGQG
jgi:hypothetical protein